MNEEITNLEPMEMTFTIEDADLDKLYDVLKDINVKECPWFEVQDKHGNKAKYYREPRKKGKWIIDGHHIKCNRCENIMCSRDREGDLIPKNYCPNCGSYNGGEEE